ncbi:MAG: DNA polymerase III subunit delta [Acidimicrobiia bacterium]
MGVWLIKGEDEGLVSAAVHERVHLLVGAGDRTLMVDEFAGDDYEVAQVVDAAQTMPFLTDRRVVVAKGVGRFTADHIAALVSYLADPMPSTDLVLVGGGGRMPKSLTDALKKAGAETVDADPPSKARDRQDWYHDQFAAAGIKLDAAAAAAVMATLGEDAGRITAICEALSASFEKGHKLTVGDVEPFLGESGSVPPWELTDAIDRGATAEALDKLIRMMRAGERHPLQVMAILTGHYGRMLRLDGAGATDEKSAAELLGIKGSTFPARKALDQSRRLGHGGITKAIALLAQADLDMRGMMDWPPDMVMEVLIARLSKLAPSPAATRRR